MKAIIKESLIKPSWSGKTILVKIIIGCKDNIVNKVNDYIIKRINKTNSIQVKQFYIEIYNYKNKKVNNWQYKPTYR